MTKRGSPKITYKHNDLFRGDDDCHLNACVGRNGGPYDFYAYSLGYFHAGKCMAASLLENSDLIDLVVYPLVFTFRHAVELGLKDLAIALPRLWDEGNDIKLTHKLLDNWTCVKAYVARPPVFSPEEPVIDVVEKILGDLVEIDPSGEAFRFPTARNGNRFLQDTSWINIRVFASALSTVADAFDFWHEIAVDTWQAKCEDEASHY